MGTKRPFDEDSQGFIKHLKHIENGNKHDSFREDKQLFEISQNVEITGEGVANFFHTNNVHEKPIAVTDTVGKPFETSASLPLVTGFIGREEASGLGPAFCHNLFPEFFEFNMPRRQLVHYDDTYSSLLNCFPRKEIPVGSEHQANVPEFDPDSARNYISNPGLDKTSMGISVIAYIDEALVTQTDCECLDSNSIRCVQQHVNEARLNLKQSLGIEKFCDLGFDNMGEEVACNWTEEEGQLFQDVVYSNPVSHGKRFWDELFIAFPSRTKKELVSYYFNVFILRRRAVQNRSQLLAIDSDDDEWWGTKSAHSEFVYENNDSSSEDGNQYFEKINENSSSIIHDEKIVSENEQEKAVYANKQEANNGEMRSESYLHWDPPYSTMGSIKGVDLLPTCSMIEEIFGSSKTSKSI